MIGAISFNAAILAWQETKLWISNGMMADTCNPILTLGDGATLPQWVASQGMLRNENRMERSRMSLESK
eukprot:7208312-Karenia_brevis.AAC.1